MAAGKQRKADDTSVLKAKLGFSQTPKRPSREVAPPVPDHQMVRCIGQGSYGDVWLARNAVGTWRAVKVVYRSNFKDERPYEREFAGIQKYEPISRTNEGLVDVLQIGRNDAEGYFYYVMELADDANAERAVQNAQCPTEQGTSRAPSNPTIQQSTNAGPPPSAPAPDPDPCASYVPRTLADELRRHGRLPFEECLTLGMTLNLALGQLHRHGLIHRDVKPSNIIFVNGVPKLADIGLVTDLAEAQSFVGTEGYIPPEGPNSPLADLYALGKVLYEAAMGKDRQEFPEPFTGLGTDKGSLALMELNAVLLRTCAREPRERYQTAEDMNADLALLHSGQSVREKYTLARRLKRMRRIAAGVATVMLLGVVPYGLALKEAARAKRAETAQREELYRSYLAQIRSGRTSHEPGQKRFAGLELVARAVKIRPSLELRNEAIACLAVPDMRLVKEREAHSAGGTATVFLDNAPIYASSDELGNISIRAFATDDGQTVLSGFGVRASEMGFSPYGRFLFAGYVGPSECPARVWDLESRKVLLIPAIAKWRCWGFSPDSKRIAIAQREEGPVGLYELPSGQEVRSFQVEDLPWDVALDSRGRLLAVSSDSSTNVLLFDVATGELNAKLPHTAVVHGVSFSPDGQVLAACADQRIQFWKTDTGKALAELTGHDSAALHAPFSHDGRLMASTCWDRRIRLWSTATLKELCSAPMDGYNVSFSPDDRWLVNDCGNALRLFEVNPANEMRLLRASPGEQPAGEGCDFSPDDRLLAVADREGVRLWDVSGGNQAAFIAVKRAHSPFFHPTKNLLYVSGSPGILAWPFEQSGSNVTIGPAQRLGPDAALSRASISPDGEKLVLVRNGNVWLMDLNTRVERLIAGSPVANPNITTLGPAAGWAGDVSPGTAVFRSACISPTGKICAVCRLNTNLVEVFDTVTGQILRTLQAGAALDLGFSPDGRSLVTYGNSEYRFWETESWACFRVDPHAGTIDQFGPIAFSPNGTMAAVTGLGQSIRLIDPASGREFANLEGYEPQTIACVVFSHDGAHLATSGGNHPAQLWDLGLIRKELAEMNLDWSLASDQKVLAKR